MIDVRDRESFVLLLRKADDKDLKMLFDDFFDETVRRGKKLLDKSENVRVNTDG